MNVHEPPKSDLVGDALAEGHFFLDQVVGVASGAIFYELLRGVHLAGEDGEHVEAGHGVFSSRTPTS